MSVWCVLEWILLQKKEVFLQPSLIIGQIKWTVYENGYNAFSREATIAKRGVIFLCSYTCKYLALSVWAKAVT